MQCVFHENKIFWLQNEAKKLIPTLFCSKYLLTKLTSRLEKEIKLNNVNYYIILYWWNHFVLGLDIT